MKLILLSAVLLLIIVVTDKMTDFSDVPTTKQIMEMGK